MTAARWWWSAAVWLTAVLAAGCGPSQEVLATRRQVARVEEGLRRFERDCGRLPTRTEGLLALTERPVIGDAAPRWRGPYCSTDDLRDVWRHRLEWAPDDRRDGRSGRVWSAGPDGLPFTADDLPGA